MCGRYVSSSSSADLARAFDVDDVVGEDLSPSWNVAPTQQVRVALERAEQEEEPVRQLRTVRWGLVPSWAKDRKIGSKMINARVETLTEKPAFRAAARRRRCLVPADGYYEWQTADGRKTPYFLHAADEEVLAFAGLYELWQDPERAEDDPDRWLWSCTIVTTSAPDTLGHVHDRCPLLIPADLRDAWLDPALTEDDAVRDLLAQVPEPRLEPHPVSTAVNNPRNNTPDLVAPS
ncbi:SOS response-associated peptidase [Umezawaea beigongshangensis]|uniref:SOS response-associated peptidase n=1 Tax=Umezawaea beigongshangensis TaxID=2780383 RepID=UPI0018F1B845|nr:SOS response-associated peptidase [Umezawaea beigongshangensis]